MSMGDWATGSVHRPVPRQGSRWDPRSPSVKEINMIRFEQGQCGCCAHFGEHHQDDSLTQIRVNGEAPDGYTQECGLPAMADINLQVAANSTCDGYQAA